MSSFLSEKKQIAIGTELRNAINKVSGELIDRSHRRHLGASEIGHECARYLWFKFHWFKPSLFIDYKTGEDVSGRMLRLFARGHDEEPKLIRWLEAIGAKVWAFQSQILHWHSESDSYWYADDFDVGDGLVVDVSELPDHVAAAKLRGVTPAQFRITGVNGHFGGSLDGIILIEKWFDDYMLLEMKTYNRKRFTELQLQGVFAADPKYFVQMAVYGREYKLDFAVFIAACKDDDDIYIEIVNLATGVSYANEAFEKADRIINSPVAPERLSENITFYKCKTCEFKGVCHNGDPADVSCRSCRFAQPVENKQWYCHRHQAIIPQPPEAPDTHINAACANWEQIK